MTEKQFWDERYAQEVSVYGEEPILAGHIGVFPGNGDILCLAEGEGRNGVFLSKSGFKVTAVDFSEVGQKKALALAEKEGVLLTYLLADLEDFDLGEGNRDGIVAIFAHMASRSRGPLYERIKKALRPGGYFFSRILQAGAA